MGCQLLFGSPKKRLSFEEFLTEGLDFQANSWIYGDSSEAIVNNVVACTVLSDCCSSRSQLRLQGRYQRQLQLLAFLCTRRHSFRMNT